MKKPGFIIFLMIMVISKIIAQEVAVMALLDSNKALIGDQLRLSLRAEKPATDRHVYFPVFTDTLGHEIEIISVGPVDTSIGSSGRLTLTQNLIISVFDTGFFEIPPIPVTVMAGKVTDTLYTVPIGFQIMPVKVDSTIRDIKAVYKVPVSLRELAPYILGLIILGLVVWLLIYYVKRRDVVVLRKAMAVSSEPPEVLAIKELEILKEQKPWMNSKVKYYYSRLSEILRMYIEGRYKTKALEQTTSEILLALKPVFSDGSEAIRLASILKLADLVKFAKVIPDADESAAQVNSAIDFVRNTSVPNVEMKDDNDVVVIQSNRSL